MEIGGSLSGVHVTPRHLLVLVIMSFGYEDEENIMGTTSNEDKYSFFNITTTF